MRRACLAAALLLLPLLVLLGTSRAGTAAPALPTVLHLLGAALLVDDDDPADTAPREVDSSRLPGPWQAITLPYAQPADLLPRTGTRSGFGISSGRNTVWYRVPVPAFAPPRDALMLYAARFKAYGPVALYVDGQLRTQFQLDGPTWYWEPLWLALDGGIRPAQPHEILVRVRQPRQLRSALASLWLGPSAAIGWRFEAREWLQVYLPLMSIGAFLACGVFSFVIWCRRGGAGYGFFALLALAQFIRSLSFFSTVRMSNDWFAWCMLNSLFWVITIVHAFQVHTHGRRQRWLNGWLIAVDVGVALFSLPPLASGGNTPLLTPLIYVLGMVSAVAVSVAGVRAGWRRHGEVLLLSVGVALCVIYGICDWALQSNFLGPESWYLGPYINLQCFILLCYIIYRHYIGAQVQVEHSNAVLASRLAQRKAELVDSYARLRQVEHTQTLTVERQRLLQDMHDGLGSSLHTALRAIEDSKPDAPAVSDVLRLCIDDLHLTIDSLEPVEADLLLLVAMLRYRLGERMQQAGIALHWKVVDVAALEWIDPRTALHILRILQEALVNVVKHAAATDVVVSTGCEGEGVVVVIADNGGGFDAGAALAAHGHQGLRNQRRRAEAIGGTIAWHSGAEGSRVVLWLPLAGAACVRD